MSDYRVEVAKVLNIQKHPNADKLDTGEINGYPVCFTKGQFQEGDLAVHIPIDSIVDCSNPRFSFLGEGKQRIKAKRLRGIFSMGFTIPNEGWLEGQNVQLELNIEKYEPQIHMGTISKALSTDAEYDPGLIPIFTDIEGFRHVKYREMFQEGEWVHVSEKLHGSNWRAVHDGTRLWVGSHKQFKKPDNFSVFWAAATKYDLENKLKEYPNIAVYGEVIGVQKGFLYGLRPGEIDLYVFDFMDASNNRYMNVEESLEWANKLELKFVPTIYTGPFKKELFDYRNGPSLVPGAKHTREGVVIRPQLEEYNYKLQTRRILKVVGEDYLLERNS